MVEDPLKRWAISELARLDREEAEEKRRILLESQKEERTERYFNAPTMDIEGNIIGRKSLSARETQ